MAGTHTFNGAKSAFTLKTATLLAIALIALSSPAEGRLANAAVLAERSGPLLGEGTESGFAGTVTVRRIGSTGTAGPVDVPAVGAHLSSIGAPDPGFGVGGVVVIDIGQDDDAYAVAQQADGKILVAGMTRHEHVPGWYFAASAVVARLMPDGGLDTTFGVGGVTMIGGVGTGGDYQFFDLAIQPDGKIVAAGDSEPLAGPTKMLVARFNANGTLDSTFASNGVLDLYLGADGYAEAVALQTDGKIVLGGCRDAKFFAARLLSNGALDVTFGTDGIKTISMALNSTSSAYDVAIQPNGKIVLAGIAHFLGDIYNEDYLGLARLLADGSLDPTFDGDGRLLPDLGTYAWGNGVAVEADGNIVVAGSMTTPAGRDAMVVRTTDTGGFDSTFDGDGVVSIDIGATSDSFNDVAIQPGGEIVVAGRGGESGVEDFVVVRLLPDGSLDPTFHGGGVIVDLGGADGAQAVAVQADGKILAAGTTADMAVGDWAILRLRATDTNTPPVLDAVGDQTVAEGDTVDVGISATDADGDALTFTLSGEPSFATLTDHGDGTATLTLTPGFDDAGSYAGVTVTVSDSVDSDSEIFTITVTVVETICVFLPVVLRSH